MSTHTEDDAASYVTSYFHQTDKKKKVYVDWVKEITVVRRQFERIMRIVMDYQSEFIYDRSEMQSTPSYEELFNDNTILLIDTLTNLIKIEKELIYERHQQKTMDVHSSSSSSSNSSISDRTSSIYEEVLGTSLSSSSSSNQNLFSFFNTTPTIITTSSSTSAINRPCERKLLL
jgi:hypothetical protein